MSDSATISATLEPLDLAALLCSRVCHDLISPVGAVVNGMEVLEDTSDESTKTFALDLIKKSANQASARLQFCRLAFGAAGSAGASIDLGDGESVARGFIEDEKVKLTWGFTRILLPKNRVKLLLNLILMASQMIPRGGTIEAGPIGEGDTMGFRLTATGSHARFQPIVASLVTGEVGDHPIDAHGIQPFYSGLLAKACSLRISLAQEGETVTITAQ